MTTLADHDATINGRDAVEGTADLDGLLDEPRSRRLATAESVRPSVVPDAARSARRAWELGEQLTDAHRQLAEAHEREGIRELEITALHRDVELKAAYASMLEHTSEERREAVGWLQAQVDQRSADLQHTVARLDAAQARIDELQAVSDALLARAVAAELRVADAERRHQEVVSELQAERDRASYRLMAPWIQRFWRNRVIRNAARRAAARAGRAEARR